MANASGCVKAAEGGRTPRRFARIAGHAYFRQVLECGCPLPLSFGRFPRTLNAFQFHTGCPMLLPLPRGEGRGEGEILTPQNIQVHAKLSSYAGLNHWSLGLGASLDVGCWNLELSA